QLARQPRVADRVLGAEAPRRVRQDRVALEVEVVEDVAPLFIDQAVAAGGGGGDLAAGGGGAGRHQVVGGGLPGAGVLPDGEAERPDDERLVRRGRLRRAASDQRDDLDGIAGRQAVLAVTDGGDDGEVDLDGDLAGVVAELAEQI